ncbi:hypothetical protein [Herbidospora cretacea]|uniref:hypothetical protein n=1 Tax=Herbidospora cretacea TaxID=28444 RepID=UPI0004C45018|nr:hypothetical protein [Herbidospora cretacea]
MDVADADCKVTRYLCRKAQSDSLFAGKLVANIIRQPYRGIAMSPGLDVVAVLKHALAGRRRRAVTDWLFTAINFPALLVTFGSVVWCVTTLSFRPLAAIPWALGISLLGSTVVQYRSRLAEVKVMTGSLLGVQFMDGLPPEPRNVLLRQRLDEIQTLAAGNLTLYQGFKPFRGYGKVIGGWSFAIDISKPQSMPGPAVQFDVYAVREYVRRQVEALDWIGLTVAEKVFISGHDTPIDDQSFIDAAGFPRALLDDVAVQKLIMARDSRARPYIVIRLLGWDGELALTMFLRFLIHKKNLFVECSHSILTPLLDSYRKAEPLPRTETRMDHVRLFLRSVRMFKRPVSGFTHISEWRDDRKALSPKGRERRRRSSDHGAFFSIREAASDSRYQRYFQKLDSEMYTKVVEQRIFDALVEFLDRHNIDTGELIQRTTTILNNGILVTGNSSIHADSVAAGQNSQANSNSGNNGSGK